MQKLTSTAYLNQLADRIRQYRIAYPMTQEQLSDRSGVSLRSIHNYESGKDICLSNFIKILSALDLQENLNALVPDVTLRPSSYLRAEKKKVRSRASGASKQSDKNTFQWGEDKV